LALIEAQGSETPCKSLRAFLILTVMKIFFIKSPSGIVYTLNAESKFHSIQKAIVKDDFKYTSNQYKQ
jgi:hypothetical protein